MRRAQPRPDDGTGTPTRGPERATRTRARSRHLVAGALPLALGAAIAAFWIDSTGGRTILRALAGARPLAFGALAVGLTAAWLVVRFVRWQFLLRRAGVRLPARGSLSCYLAALPGTATPAYAGEVLRALLLRRRFGTPVRPVLLTLVLDRLFDVAALAVLALATASSPGIAGLVLLAVAVIGAALWTTRRIFGPPADGVRLWAPSATALAFALSLAAWATAALLVPVAARAFGVRLGLGEGIGVFAGSTLLGAATFAPAGVGATGSFAILALGRLGLPQATGVLIVSLVRLASTGVALLVGCGFLFWELRLRRGSTQDAAAHFDDIAEHYRAQWSAHIWDLLIERKLGMIADALPAPAAEAGVGLDLGCGLGLQLGELRARGYRVMGLDPAVGLLAAGGSARRGAPVLAGSALEIPLRDGSLDFVYAVGVLHHLPGRLAQRTACREIARVLKPGGVLLVHESNPRNPMFRFYMGYAFPILKPIDEGTEWWIDPRLWDRGSEGQERLAATDELRLERVRYFTFLPDFLPRAFLGAALALERLLERGPTRPFSAHYFVMLRRTERSAAAAPEALAREGHEAESRRVAVG